MADLRRFELVVALPLFLLVVPSAAQQAQTRFEPQVQNLGLDLEPYLFWTLNVIASPELQAFRVSEARQGADLNGDGDRQDHVLFVFDPLRGRVRNLGLAVLANPDYNLRPQVDGGTLAFLVNEDAQGHTDLSGDGSNNYFALHVYDLATDRVVNVHSQGPFFALSDGILAYTHGTVPGQSNELRVLDLRRGTTTTIATGPCYRVACSGRLVAYDRPESQAGDLNGDGDANDSVVQVYDIASGTTTNLGFAQALDDLSLRVRGGTVSFLVSEAAQGVDLNGDGAANGYAPCAYLADSATTLVFPYRVAPVPLNQADISSFRLLAEDLMTFTVVETTGDLNGDGDALDTLLVAQPLTGGRPPLRMASIGPFAWNERRGLLAFFVTENAQAHADRNGDGDAFDNVLHLYEPATGGLTNLGFAGNNATWDREGTLAFEVWENNQGQADLDGDGDHADAVWFLRTPSGRVSNTRLAGEAKAPSDFGRFRFDVEESLIGRDLNGDGDASDRLLVAWDGRTGRSAVLSLPISGLGPETWASSLFTVSEAVAGHDLNGDGDTADQVLHRVGP
jgi:hypothetical protein